MKHIMFTAGRWALACFITVFILCAMSYMYTDLMLRLSPDWACTALRCVYVGQ